MDEPQPAPRVPDRGLRLLGWLLLIVALGFVLLFVVVPVFLTEVTEGPRNRTRDGIGNLVKLHLVRSTDKMQGYRPPYSGRAFVLAVVADGLLDPAPPGALDVFFAMDDAGRPRPSVAEYQALTHARLAAGGDFRRFTSYVGRRNTDSDAKLPTLSDGSPQAIMADLVSHRDGAMVGFADGRVEFLTRAALGLGPDDPMVAGPTSRSPILRLLGE